MASILHLIKQVWNKFLERAETRLLNVISVAITSLSMIRMCMAVRIVGVVCTVKDFRVYILQ